MCLTETYLVCRYVRYSLTYRRVMESLLNIPYFESNGHLMASAVAALAVALFCWQLIAVLTFPRDRLGAAHPFELSRREELRAKNIIYRWFEPLVEEIASFLAPRQPKLLHKLQQNLIAGREKLPWKPEEFLAAKLVEGICMGAVLFLMLWVAGWGKASVVLGISVMGGYSLLAPKMVRDRGRRRLARMRVRLPFAVDLIALMMEAGGGFQECLKTAVVENGNHPLTEEMAEVLRQISLGRPRKDALLALQDRLHDPDVNELVFAIIKGEELGTPLSAILRDQAEQMRIKRSQRGEKAAAEAQVNIVFPGMVVMIACLLVVIAPIVLPAVNALF
jgi:pilus assembly protein TadC